jgi:hypothetical protein
MEKLFKLESLACWVGETGIYPCDTQGMPITEDIVYFEDIKAEWYGNLSQDEKEIMSAIISNKKQ